jgi:predicted AAA+ superfamily ATPase
MPHVSLDTPSIFSAVQPRQDVLEGILSDAIFAASLDEVVFGKAPAVYGDPATFFTGTHPSGGLRTLLDEVLGRVGGGKTDAPSVVRLETNLGGGKTHNLIALYHAARGALPAERVAQFMTPSLYPSEPVDQLAVFVGTAAGATAFPEVDGVAARTLWGYLALQLGGSDRYSYVREDDEALTAPGTDALRDVLAGRSTLFLIDELARYLETASGVTVGSTTLARQTVAFLMALMEAVDAHPRASLVVTTTQVTDAFGDSTQAVLDATARQRGDEIGPLLAWQELKRDSSSGFGFVEQFGERLGVEVYRAVPTDADGAKATLTRQEAGRRLYALIEDWKARSAALPGSQT